MWLSQVGGGEIWFAFLGVGYKGKVASATLEFPSTLEEAP